MSDTVTAVTVNEYTARQTLVEYVQHLLVLRNLLASAEGNTRKLDLNPVKRGWWADLQTKPECWANFLPLFKSRNKTNKTADELKDDIVVAAIGSPSEQPTTFSKQINVGGYVHCELFLLYFFHDACQTLFREVVRQFDATGVLRDTVTIPTMKEALKQSVDGNIIVASTDPVADSYGWYKYNIAAESDEFKNNPKFTALIEQAQANPSTLSLTALQTQVDAEKTLQKDPNLKLNQIIWKTFWREAGYGQASGRVEGKPGRPEIDSISPGATTGSMKITFTPTTHLKELVASYKFKASISPPEKDAQGVYKPDIFAGPVAASSLTTLPTTNQLSYSMSGLEAGKSYIFRVASVTTDLLTEVYSAPSVPCTVPQAQTQTGSGNRVVQPVPAKRPVKPTPVTTAPKPKPVSVNTPTPKPVDTRQTKAIPSVSTSAKPALIQTKPVVVAPQPATGIRKRVASTASSRPLVDIHGYDATKDKKINTGVTKPVPVAARLAMNVMTMDWASMCNGGCCQYS